MGGNYKINGTSSGIRNLKAAAENERTSIIDYKTKAAEGRRKRHKNCCRSRKNTAQLRGQGVALVIFLEKNVE